MLYSVYLKFYVFFRPELFCKKGGFINFAKFTRKHLCQSLFFNKKRLQHNCFPENVAQFLRTPFLYYNSSGCFWLSLFLHFCILRTHSYFFLRRILMYTISNQSLNQIMKLSTNSSIFREQTSLELWGQQY